MLDPTADHDQRLLRIALAIIAQPGHLDVHDCAERRGMPKTINVLADTENHLATLARRPCWKRLRTTPEKLYTAAADLTDHAVIPDDPWWPTDQINELDDLGIPTPWCL